MLDVSQITQNRHRAGPVEILSDDLYPYFAELLEDAPQIVLDYVAEDLDVYERTGRASATIERMLRRARCLAESDRIAMKYAA